MHIGEEDEGLNEQRFRRVADLTSCDRAEIHRDEGHSFRKLIVASIVDRFIGVTLDW